MCRQGLWCAPANLLKAAAAVLALLLPAHTAAQSSFPDRPVRILVGFAPGGPADVIARIVGERLSDAWGQPVLVENVPGAGANIAGERVARAPRNCYTLLMATNAQITVNPVLYDKMTFDPLLDLAPISQIVFVPNILVVNNGVPANSVQELVALARSQPAQLTFGSAGIGTTQHLSGELFKSLAQLDIRHVPYRGAMPVITDLLGGHVSMFFGSASPLVPLIRDRKLRALAVTSSKRFFMTPELPTMIEAGFPGFDASASFALMAPSGTPPELINKIHRDTVAVLSEPATRKRVLDVGMAIIGNSPTEFAAALKAEVPQWTSLIKEVGLVAKEKSPLRVSFVSPAHGPGPGHETFIQQLRTLGYEQGRNVFVDWKWLGERHERLGDAVAEVTRSGAGVLVAQSAAVAVALQKSTKYTPIVFLDVRDPVADGLVAILNRPSSNATGVTLTPGGELTAKQIELLREVVPGARRVAIFWNPATTDQRQFLEMIRSAGERLAVSIQPFEIRSSADIERAFETIGRDRFDGLVMLLDSLTLGQRAFIARQAIDLRLPTVFEVRDYVDAGGLMSYGLQYQNHYTRAANYVDRILKGATAADLPVEEPTKFELVINLRAARSLGVTLSPKLLALADDVID